MNKPSGDAVISRAFRRSVFALVAGAVIVGLVVAFLRWQNTQTPEVLPETTLTAPVIQPQADEKTPPEVVFTNATEDAGIRFTHRNGATGNRYLPETMGGGVAVFDYDLDGALDVLLVGSSSWSEAGYEPQSDADGQTSSVALYRNDGSGRFEDVTAKAGLDLTCYCMGAAVADVNADGRLDVYLTALGHNILLLNTPAGFVRQPGSLGAAGALEAWSTSAAFVDYDNDGWLDLYVANYVKWSPEIDREVNYQLAGIGRAYGPPNQYAGTNSYLFRNVDGVRFEDVSSAAGIVVQDAASQPVGKALGVLAWDWDEDGFPDLFVANDTTRNFAFHNQGDGTFREVGSESGVAFDNAGKATGAMGVDFLERDGQLSVAVANFANEMTSFYVRPQRQSFFTDEAVVAGIGPATRRALSFGLFFFDYDLDGQADLFQANGHVEPLINEVQPSQQYEQPVQLFWQCGPDCPRQFVLTPAGEALSQPLAARGAAYGDFDGDADLDLLVVSVGAKAHLFRNEQNTGHHWVRLDLRQAGPNAFAYGAKVEVSAGETTQVGWVSPSRSYLSHMPLTKTFGLGEYAGEVTARVTWPDGQVQSFPGLAADQTHLLTRR